MPSLRDEDWRRSETGAAIVGHTNTCLCAQCEQSFTYHIAVLHGPFTQVGRACQFCESFRYAQRRADMSEKDGGKPNIMSTMNICERCETFALGKAMGQVEYNLSPTEPSKTVDLCPGCVEEFLQWFSAGEVSGLIGNRPRAYKTPFEPKTDTDGKPNVEELLSQFLNQQAALLAIASGDDIDPRKVGVEELT